MSFAAKTAQMERERAIYILSRQISRQIYY